jgi:hypothetical protein
VSSKVEPETPDGDDVPKNSPVSLRHGNGWAVLDTSCYSENPGVQNIGAALELTSATMMLVVLRAAESWAPEVEDVAQPDAIICRHGRILVEFTDGSTQQLDLDAQFLRSTHPLIRVTNLNTSIADVLLITRKAG